MNKKFHVACLQTNSSNIPEENILMLENMFSKINQKSFDLICLPECVAIFSDCKKTIDDFHENWHKEFMNFIFNQSRRMNANILIGSIPYKKKNKKFLNRSILVNPKGKVISQYDKINLFDVSLGLNEKYCESRNYDPGKQIQIAKLPWGNIGMSICYDIRFPSLYKKLAKKGAHFFSIPAAFTHTTGKSHWHTLIRARAIENGCFVFAAAQCGYHKNGRHTFGHSLIVDPWGKIIAEAGEKPCIISASVETKLIPKIRKKIPSMTNYFL